jgi:cell division protein FtsI/penicillin-binding protein 2
VVREGMIAAVTASDGSARGLERADIPLAAKTGTAEVGSRSNRHKNAWVVCYGPLPVPRFALACIIEEGDTGGRTAVPIAAQFLRLWQSRGGDIAGVSSQVGATTPAP